MLCFIISRKEKYNHNVKNICAVYGKDAVTDLTCQNWFVKFRVGDFLLDNASRSGQSLEFDRDQTKTLIENNQCYTMQEIADILKIFKSIKLLMKMKNRKN